MIAMIAAAAMAEPARGELIAGWAGNATQGFGFLTWAPALARSDDAGFVVRGSVSQLYYSWYDQGVVADVSSPGASIGPAFVYAPGDLSLGAGVGFEARRPTTTVEGQAPVTTTELGATLGANIYWKPAHRAVLYGIVNFGAANEYLWARVGGMIPIIPMFRGDTPVSLWIGPELTSSGNEDIRVLELGGVAEVPVKSIHAAFSVRAGISLQDLGDRAVQQGTIGVGAYWAY